MKQYTNILFDVDNSIAWLTFNRPEVHNAFNPEMIEEITGVFSDFGRLEKLRAVVIRGKGKSFCAGADLNYMKSIAGFGYEENYHDSLKLAGLFQAIYDCPIPVIAVVHGAVFGGANGIIAACDIVIAEEQTTFAFSEVKLGIAPATIGPFVFRRIGEAAAKELMLTGKRFKGPEAFKHRLVNHSLPENEVEEMLDFYLKQINSSAPGAVKETKKMIWEISSGEKKELEMLKYTADLIARRRASDEGQEGMLAFFEKRKPSWHKKK